MMANGDNIQDTLAHAPLNAAPDASTARADAISNTADALSDMLTNPLDFKTPAGAKWDSGKARPPVFDATKPPVEEPEEPEELRPGSFGFHLAKAVSDTLTNPSTVKMATAPGGATRNLFLGVMQALGATAPQPTRPAERPVPTSGPWAEATSNASATRPSVPVPTSQTRGPLGDALARLGDVAGGGGFVGAAKRRTQRTAEEMKDRQVMATSNAQMLHEQALTHKMGEDAINESIKDQKAGMDAIVNPVPGGAPGNVDVEGKTSDELSQMIRNGELDPSKQTVFATGRTLTGRDANGLPLYRTTYSVVTPAGQTKVTPENAKLLNEQLGASYPVSDDPAKQQTLPGVQLNAQLQKAYSAKAAKRAFEVQDAKDQKVVDEAQTSKDAQTIRMNPVVVNAINSHDASRPGAPDPFAVVKAYDYLMDNMDKFGGKLPKNFSDAYVKAAGGTSEWNKLREEYAKTQQKNSETVLDMLNTLETKPQEMEGKTPAFGAAMKAIINSNDPQMTPEVKARAAQQLKIIKDVEAHETNLKAEEAGAKKKAEETAAMGDVDSLIEAAKKYQLDPQKMFGIRGGQRAEFMSKMLKADPTWDEKTYAARYQTAKEFTPEGKGGLQVQSLNAFTGHAGDADGQIADLKNSNVVLYNTAMNKLETQMGHSEFLRMQAALEAVKDEYLNFLKNGHAPNEQELKRAEDIVNPNLSPKQIHDVISQMANTVSIRGSALQHNYTRTMGKPYDAMLEPENADILKNFGINTDRMTGVPSEPKAPKGATITYRDPKTNEVAGWAVNGKFVPVKPVGAP